MKRPTTFHCRSRRSENRTRTIRIRTSGSTSPDLNDGGCAEVCDDGGWRGMFEPERRTRASNDSKVRDGG
ncbi:hypothetical protein U1Q18_023412 [Sarracenia purpurea var. burkii]